MFMCPAPPATLNMFWYQGSLSCALQKIAHNTKGRLAPEISASLTEAAGRVFIQESYVNDLLVASAGCSISPDPLFVYGGYMNALSNLLGVLTLPGFEGTSRGRACRSMHMHLQTILTVIHLRGNDVTSLFKDPNMNKALADLARFNPAF
ncbi:hypothetical protein RSOL_097020 [Rhizoctonia solani AG-3 Rhs1AP]|uniref:Uncharacterized protein n=1 Tax=Rhizoctonia solani AG-3 Rhs1AP TaxID=1086054 RepID=X8IZI2_9AGAM|nr:hypothetical protein RSOL_097020 [Rhizoctonia solani AG-3 Rhs1AP]